ncbi:hypothetical protein ig2599ANME_0792 [groundwater metagenome]
MTINIKEFIEKPEEGVEYFTKTKSDYDEWIDDPSRKERLGDGIYKEFKKYLEQFTENYELAIVANSNLKDLNKNHKFGETSGDYEQTKTQCKHRLANSGQQLIELNKKIKEIRNQIITIEEKEKKIMPEESKQKSCEDELKVTKIILKRRKDQCQALEDKIDKIFAIVEVKNEKIIEELRSKGLS